MAFEALLAEYEKRQAKALAMGGPEKLARRKKAGTLNARERIALLFDPGTFLESGLFGASGVYPEEADETPTDGKIAGYGKIGGRDVAAVVNDFTVKGASTSATNSKKVAHMKRTATERGMPLVIIGESTGARLPDAMGSRGMGQLLGNDPTQFRRLRESPMAAAVLGPSFGSSAWLACLSDFAVMHKGATMAVSSPRLIEMALNEKVDFEELGGWRLHADITGLVDQVVDSEEEVFEAIRRFLSYLPSHNQEAPPDAPVPAGSGADMSGVFGVLPESRTQVYDMKRIIRAIIDKDTLVRVEAALRQERGHRARAARRQERRASSPTIRCIAAARSTPTPAARSPIFWCCAIPSTCRSCCSWTRRASRSAPKPRRAARRARS